MPNEHDEHLHAKSIDDKVNLTVYCDKNSAVEFQDIFSVIYVVAKLYTLGYEMSRPSPDGWGIALGEVVSKMAAIQNAIGALSSDILRIQQAIENLPAVINGIVETQLIQDTLRTANARASLLRTYMHSEATMTGNFSSIQRLNDDLIIDLEKFSSWYSAHNNGAFSFFMTMAPLVSTSNLCFDFVQVKIWENQNPNHKGEYPLNTGEILNHTDLEYTKIVCSAYTEIISATDVALTKYGKESEATNHDGEQPPYVLILDEMNRADLSRTLGECFSLLENRDESIDLPGLDQKELPLKLHLPKNLYVIGTMNLIDQSIEQIDFALRRRFLWLECRFDPKALLSAAAHRWKELASPIAWSKVEPDFKKLAIVAQALNLEIHKVTGASSALYSPAPIPGTISLAINNTRVKHGSASIGNIQGSHLA